MSSYGAGLPLKSRGGYAVQAAQSLFVLKAGRARGAFFELKLKTCPEVGVILTPLRRDTFSMVRALADTAEYEPQALIYHYNLHSTVLSPASNGSPRERSRASSGSATSCQSRVRPVPVHIGTRKSVRSRKTAAVYRRVSAGSQPTILTNKQSRHIY